MVSQGICYGIALMYLIVTSYRIKKDDLYSGMYVIVVVVLLGAIIGRMATRRSLD